MKEDANKLRTKALEKLKELTPLFCTHPNYCRYRQQIFKLCNNLGIAVVNNDEVTLVQTKAELQNLLNAFDKEVQSYCEG